MLLYTIPFPARLRAFYDSTLRICFYALPEGCESEKKEGVGKLSTSATILRTRHFFQLKATCIQHFFVFVNTNYLLQPPTVIITSVIWSETVLNFWFIFKSHDFIDMISACMWSIFVLLIYLVMFIFLLRLSQSNMHVLMLHFMMCRAQVSMESLILTTWDWTELVRGPQL